jgi:hypothetical protein
MNYPIDTSDKTRKFTFLELATDQPVVDGNGKPQRNRDYPLADGSEYVSDTVMILEQVEPTPPSFDSTTQHLTRGDWTYDKVAQTASRPYVIVEKTPEEIAAEARTAARSEMRASWDALPAYIKGPYRPLFDSANLLLNEGDDVSAAEMIDAAEPTAKIANDPTMTATFAATKVAFAAAIEAL